MTYEKLQELGWRRRVFNTRGADPTVMVTWEYKHPKVQVEITEFQNVYLLKIDGKDNTDAMAVFGATLFHQDFEEAYHQWLSEVPEGIDEDYPFSRYYS